MADPDAFRGFNRIQQTDKCISLLSLLWEVNQRTSIKIGLSAILVIFASAVLHIHVNDQLFPAAYVGFFISLCICLALSRRISRRTGVSLLAVTVFVAVLYRLLMFGHPPAYVSTDVEWFLARAHEVSMTGSTDSISAQFYRVASLYIVFLSILDQILATNLFIVQASVPLLLGSFTPMIAWTLTGRVRSSDIITKLVASIIAAGATFGVFHSWFPIAQSITVPFFLLGIWALIYIGENDKRFPILIILVILGTGLMISHKIPLLLFVVVFLSIATISRWVHSSLGPHYRTLPILFGILLAVQMVIMTEYLTSVIEHAILSTGIENMEEFTANAAVVVSQGLVWTVARGANLFGILSIGGIAWLFGVYRWYRTRSSAWMVVLISTAISVAFTIALIPSGKPTRGLMMIEPVLAVIISFALLSIYRSANSQWDFKRVAAGIAIIGLLATQSFAVIGMPDGPGQPTRYPYATELAGKDHALEYGVEEPHMDRRYAEIMVDPRQPNTKLWDNWYDNALLNASVNPEDHPTVLYREREIYRTTHGWYRLTWDPESSYNVAYNRVYDNSGSTYYV